MNRSIQRLFGKLLRRRVQGMTGLAFGLALAVLAVPAGAASEDPLGSVMWEYNRDRYLGDAPVVFDDRVLVDAPPFAEDSTQVPVTVDARALDGKIQRIEAWVSLNPVPPIFTYTPVSQALPLIALRVRVEQATTIRAAVLTEDGVWHVGGTYVEAAGGGCTAPSRTRANPNWERHFGEIRTASFSRANAERFRVQVSHPMDSGMVGNIPEFHIEQAILRTAAGDELLRLALGVSVSENPVLTLELEPGVNKPVLWLRDNNGNEFQQQL